MTKKNMYINANVPMRFKPAEFHCFNWIYNFAPCFPINASKVSVINDPKKFYDTLCERFRNANRRISVASLYFGTGSLEKRLLEITKENVYAKKELKFSVLLDYQRGTRGDYNSVTMFRDILDASLEQCSISLYQTPRLQVLWSKALPSRYNELVGLQHMKLYIADDCVLLSGANCSNDYFQERQDRYIQIEDPELANFYSELIDEVKIFSKTCTNNGVIDNYQGSKEQLVKEFNSRINNHINKWKKKQLLRVVSMNLCNDNECDTWIFPLIQMGEINVTQDETVTRTLIASAPKCSYIQLATGYFNLTDQYARTLLKDCKANISLLMAHPNANGFLGASGPAGGIPHAYSFIARKFWESVVDYNQASRIRMLEYERYGWTFHAKGLWYYPPGSGVPWATIVGSANLGERSVRRDLEAQAVIFTVSPELQERLRQESFELHRHAKECGAQLEKRETPLWVRAAVGFFRTYF